MIHLFPTRIEKPYKRRGGRVSYRWVLAYCQVTENGHILPAQTYTEWVKQKQPFKRHETETAAKVALRNE